MDIDKVNAIHDAIVKVCVMKHLETDDILAVASGFMTTSLVTLLKAQDYSMESIELARDLITEIYSIIEREIDKNKK